MKITIWRALAFLLLGALVFSVQHMDPARAFSSPTYYPVNVLSYAGMPCPSSVTINGQSITIGDHCSNMYNGHAALIQQSDPTGWSVVIGPGWQQQCKDGSWKSLPNYTYSGQIPNRNNPRVSIPLTNFPSVCPGYFPSSPSLWETQASYGDSGWSWFINIVQF